MRYEGYGPGGVAVIVEALTDNRNRNRGGGPVDLLQARRVAGRDQFRRVQLPGRSERSSSPASAAGAEEMFEAALEAGAEDVASDAEAHAVTTAPDDFSAVRDALEQRFGEADRAGLGLAAAEQPRRSTRSGPRPCSS